MGSSQDFDQIIEIPLENIAWTLQNATKFSNETKPNTNMNTLLAIVNDFRYQGKIQGDF